MSVTLNTKPDHEDGLAGAAYDFRKTETTESPDTYADLVDGLEAKGITLTGEESDLRHFPDFPHVVERSMFSICDDASANWLLNKVAALDEQKERLAVQYAAMVADIDKDRARLIGRFGPELETLARQKIYEARGKSKTAKFLAGNVSFRSVPGGLRLVDNDAALQEAQEHFARFVQLVPKLDTAAYRENAKKVLETTGDLLPGCDLVPDRESMSIKFPKKGDVI